MECFICLDGDNPEPTLHLGCACRSDSGFAHVACMARLARSRCAESASWRECRTCKQKLTGRMLHMLCGHATETGEAVCCIHELLGAANGDIPVARAPINDQTCFRVDLPADGAFSALSIAARLDGSGYEAALLDAGGRVATARGFDREETPLLLSYIRAVLICARLAEKSAS